MKNNEKLFIINKISQIIYDKKGFNILVLDVREDVSFTDYIIIAEGSVERHVKSIAESIIEELKNQKCFSESQNSSTISFEENLYNKDDNNFLLHIEPIHIEGFQNGDWVVIDYLDIMVHLFIPILREKYQLERVWKNGKIIDVQIKVKNLVGIGANGMSEGLDERRYEENYE